MNAEEHAAALVADWPALPDDQLERIAVLLRASTDGSEHEDTPATSLDEAS